ncbi:hypothetical protein LCGC14_0121370 [marine sediment metagenome]|uniref:Sulfurtransferase complex subunit TusB n=1 Tax=marine sediment metagenome TaxID=412755 RepID=A0A0F9XP32_9ZZZZ|nr:sulfurtransferase complex subunit TusB [Halomonas sp.]HDZ46760.1 sulfurtransferase complex subunit TusB [Halomonas sp.]HEB03201.1 sulfurtransferase complex subunit TusB [Halomonas sp.]
MMLHILTKAPHSTAAIQMQQVVGEGDAVVLIEEAVTAVLNPEWLAWKSYQSRIFILVEDVVSRGLASIAKANALPLIDMDELVTLTEQHTKSVTWY